MPIKQLLQKIYKKLFISRNSYEVKFQVLNRRDDVIWKKYHDDLAYLCEAEIMDKGKEPKGAWIIYGNNKTNIVSSVYNRRRVTIDKIQKCLESYGLKVKQIHNAPLKKFLGIIEF